MYRIRRVAAMSSSSTRRTCPGKKETQKGRARLTRALVSLDLIVEWLFLTEQACYSWHSRFRGQRFGTFWRWRYYSVFFSSSSSCMFFAKLTNYNLLPFQVRSRAAIENEQHARSLPVKYSCENNFKHYETILPFTILYSTTHTHIVRYYTHTLYYFFSKLKKTCLNIYILPYQKPTSTKTY